MSHLEKRQRRLSDGRKGPVHWRARYRDNNGRECSQTFERRIDAERFLERTGADVQRGEWIDPALRRTSFDEWASAWWATTVRLRPTTRRGYHQLLHGHVLPYFGARPLASIDFMDIEEFIAAKLNEARLGPKRIRDVVSVISLVMKAAVARVTSGRRIIPGHAPLSG